MGLCSDARQTERHHSPRVNALAKAGIELEENEPDIEEAPEKGGLANRGFRGLGPCVEGYGPSTPLLYYNVTATLWGCTGQPLESLLGVILVPLQKPWPRSLVLHPSIGVVPMS